ncbi:hypothetical protein EV175_003968 [Coemansia sp. RSA 1933]|nr:hypothetical protein EV175_003968 [Coemansia sp. RSA 1933]
MRQSIVARLAQHLSLRSLVVPAAVWIRDLVFWRRPRGAVFGVYVRDVVGNYMEESLRAPMINALVSKGVFSVYMVMLRGVLAARRAATDVVATLGRITRVASKREADDGADADAAADVEVVFMAPDSTGRQQDRQQQRSQRQSRIGADRLAQQHAEGELLVYMRFVSALVSGIVTRAVVYPVDALVVRLMADETALTAYGYTGFFDCLARSPRGLASLYAGFTRALVADMVFGWAAAELAHVLCKTAWIQT